MECIENSFVCFSCREFILMTFVACIPVTDTIYYVTAEPIQRLCTQITVAVVFN